MVRNHRHFFGRSLLAVLLTAVAVLPTIAAEDDPLASGEERHLNGHGFMTSLYVDDPFVSSEFRNFTGGGMAMDLTTVFRDLNGDPLFTLDGNLFFASLGVGYQQKLGSKWAVGAQVSANVRSGTNAESFITEGADVDRQGGLWVKYRIKRTERSQLAVGVKWDYSKILYFTPADFARHIAAGGSLEDAPILIDTKVWTTRVIANWAHAFSPRFGLKVNGAFGLYEDPITSGVSKGSHRLGIMGELDMKHGRSGIPLGFTLGFTQALPDNDPYAGVSGLLLGIWYTGKKDFTVGAELGSMKQAVENQASDKVKAVFGVLTIRYYF